MIDVAKEYGVALFELAREKDILKEVSQELELLDDEFSASPEYVMFLCSPGIPKNERLSAVAKVTEGMHEYVRSFVSILTEHNRMNEFHRCKEEFDLLFNESQKLSKAYVTSAVELTAEQREKLKAKLEKMSGHEVELVMKVDETLLAGITVNMDDTVIDGSLKRRLHNLKEVIDK